MKSRLFWLLLVLPTAALARFPVPTEQAATEFGLQQLMCVSDPNPSPLLTFFIMTGHIRPHWDIDVDSVSCWRLIRPFALAGLPVSAVCGFDNDDLIQSENPGLYSRGPGTSPGTLIAFITPLDQNEAADWVARQFARIHPDIHPNTTMPGIHGTIVECNSMDINR